MKPVIPNKVVGASIMRGRTIVQQVTELYSERVDVSTALTYAKHEGLITPGEYADAANFRAYRGDLSKLKDDDFVVVDKENK